MPTNQRKKSKDFQKQQNVATKNDIISLPVTQIMNSQQGEQKQIQTEFKKYDGGKVFCQELACRKCKENMKRVGVLSEQIKEMRQKNMDMIQEIEMMANNFSYIMELAGMNIMNGVQLRTKKVLKEKQEIIMKKNEIIKRLESESQVMMVRLDQEGKREQRIKYLQEKIKKLENQNCQFRLENKVGQLKIDSSRSVELELKDTSSFRTGDISPVSEQNFQYNFTLLNLKCKGNIEAKAEQKKTLTSSLEIRNKSYSMNKSTKLQDLKEKINKIKNELLMQKV